MHSRNVLCFPFGRIGFVPGKSQWEDLLESTRHATPIWWRWAFVQVCRGQRRSKRPLCLTSRKQSGRSQINTAATLMVLLPSSTPSLIRRLLPFSVLLFALLLSPSSQTPFFSPPPTPPFFFANLALVSHRPALCSFYQHTRLQISPLTPLPSPHTTTPSCRSLQTALPPSLPPSLPLFLPFASLPAVDPSV